MNLHCAIVPELNKNPVEGFSAGLIDDDDIYQWEVVVIGPQDTLLWVEYYDQVDQLHSLSSISSNSQPFLTCSEGGFFKAHLIFPKDYPLRPPKMKFITEVWHPNGKDKWSTYSC